MSFEVLDVMNSEELKTKLTEADNKLVVIYFFATLSPLCETIAEKLHKLSEKNKIPVVFVKVDVDKCESIAKEYQIRTAPTFRFIQGGKELFKFGSLRQKMLQNMIEIHLSLF